MFVHVLRQLRNVEDAVPYRIVLRVGDSSHSFGMTVFGRAQRPSPTMFVRVLRQLRNVEGAVPYRIVLRVGDSSLRSERHFREGAETLPYEIVRNLFHFLFEGFKAGAEVF